MPKGVTYNQTQANQAEAIADAFIEKGLGVGTGGGGTATPTLVNTSTSGTVTAGKISVSIANIGAAAGTLLGTSFPTGASIAFEAPTGKTLAAIAYNATGTTFLIGVLE
ncbi:hypothetical protein Ava_D0003 [Trichormus variabilis ATCC 29413]|uniref:Uncharacterized protein n=2 Tax=Anabaena variabilis TaxID=264691 RepID=Q3M2W8_TRIV2|nr:hypothetical protein [Trichormus variabilis]ABA24668.1 hypothetical protein Ava_D0003 [Trichormus variabilis ATCC 29413]MBC1217703.1 hypothetical protein [Trichormus variabilis ARAD]MBC1259006.1 hypothetical protein [Trichormus variabilis V5]MBC1302717.1 hypothetical protein [Trichormus variabilis N2B]MBC1324572.1 hypothetical protein [Trichormus variabilis 9RC]